MGGIRSKALSSGGRGLGEGVRWLKGTATLRRSLTLAPPPPNPLPAGEREQSGASR
jgi:hypothetical protein